MTSLSYLKTKASSIDKLATLPRYRHPADLINETFAPMKLQTERINGEKKFGEGLYGSESYEALVKELLECRAGHKKANKSSVKKEFSTQEINSWNSYLKIKTNELEESKIYQAILVAKERNEERLTLNRFIQFFDYYGKGNKFDIQLHPLVLMKLIYPHWGYLNLFPSIPVYRLTLDEVTGLIEELVVVSNERKEGNSLHSAELLSFVFWKLYTRKLSLFGQVGELSQQEFCELLSYFKFNTQIKNIQKEFEYTLKDEIIMERDEIRFDIWRRIFLDRNL